MRKFVREEFYKVLTSNPILDLWRKIYLQNKVIILMYHEVLNYEEDIDAWTVVKKSDFIRQMDYLRSHFNVISLEEAIMFMRHPNNIRGNFAVVTFDDGYSGNRNVMLPIIESMALPVTVFVATGAVENRSLYWYDRVILALQSNGRGPIEVNLEHWNLGTYHVVDNLKEEGRWTRIQEILTKLKTLSPTVRDEAAGSILKQVNKVGVNTSQPLSPLSVQELKELCDSQFVTIGAHSHCHNILVQLDHSSARESIAMSKKLLETWTGRSVLHFAYPNGDFNSEVIDVLEKTGFTSAMTTVSRPWKSGDSLFAIPRIGIGRYDSFDLFKAKVSGVWG